VGVTHTPVTGAGALETDPQVKYETSPGLDFSSLVERGQEAKALGPETEQGFDKQDSVTVIPTQRPVCQAAAEGTTGVAASGLPGCCQEHC
jgi:hypothetical protein